VTGDDVYDASPTFSPDGRSLVISSVVGNGYSKLFRIDLDNPRERFQITDGEWNDKDAVFSPTGRRLYFTSDRQRRPVERRRAAGARGATSNDQPGGRQHLGPRSRNRRAPQVHQRGHRRFQPTVLSLGDGRSGWSTPATGRGVSTST
jgi:Tol biopolymer transport system component